MTSKVHDTHFWCMISKNPLNMSSPMANVNQAATIAANKRGIRMLIQLTDLICHRLWFIKPNTHRNKIPDTIINEGVTWSENIFLSKDGRRNMEQRLSTNDTIITFIHLYHRPYHIFRVPLKLYLLRYQLDAAFADVVTIPVISSFVDLYLFDNSLCEGTMILETYSLQHSI